MVQGAKRTMQASAGGASMVQPTQWLGGTSEGGPATLAGVRFVPPAVPDLLRYTSPLHVLLIPQGALHDVRSCSGRDRSRP